MLLKISSIKNKTIRRVLEHSLYLAILFVLIPSFLFFELTIVLPFVAEEWSPKYCIHMCIAAFLLQNIIGNMIFGMMTDTSIKGRLLEGNCDANWTLCSVCECMRPPRAWHCELCDICILKRDHHCTFFARCIGYFNQRYFIFFVFYIFIAMVYSLYYNIIFLSAFISWNHGFILMKFVFPLASFVVDFGEESIYIFLVVINVIVVAFTGFLFVFHVNNILQGKTTPERKNCRSKSCYNEGWVTNLTGVFGRRWYLTWISPFIESILPGDGIHWDVDEKYK